MVMTGSNNEIHHSAITMIVTDNDYDGVSLDNIVTVLMVTVVEASTLGSDNEVHVWCLIVIA